MHAVTVLLEYLNLHLLFPKTKHLCICYHVTVVLEYQYLTAQKQEAIMHLSMSCPTPTPTPRVGWGSTGDLTNSHVKFPSTGAKKRVKTPPCFHFNRGASIDLIYLLKNFFGSANCHSRNPQGWGKCRCQIPSRCIGTLRVGGGGGGGGGVDIDRCIIILLICYDV